MAKINSTYGSGYRIDHDFDARRFTEEQKKEKRSRTAADLEKEAVKRQTWMLPFNILCNHCGQRIGRATKVYANVRRLGKERRYLGKISLYSLTVRCIFCTGKIVFETDPESEDYKVISGGERTEGDWKELRDQASKEEQKAQALDDEMSRQQALLEESQRNAEKAEELTKFLEAQSKRDFHGSIDSALGKLRQGGGGSGQQQDDSFAAARKAIRGLGDDDEDDNGDEGCDFDETEWLEALGACSGANRVTQASAVNVVPPSTEQGSGAAGNTSSSSRHPAPSTKTSAVESEETNIFLLPDDLLPPTAKPTAAAAVPPTAAKRKKKSGLSKLMD